MRNEVIHKAHTRGFVDHGWLKSHHSFSFASYYDPSRVGFGLLRVINDDFVAQNMGFDTHSHKDMEIISIPLSGALKHNDTLGNEFIIRAGEVQVMSAGTGISHSEYNASGSEEVNFLQIWVYPKEKNVPPAYSQKKFERDGRKNKFQLIVSPDGRDDSVVIYQDAYFTLLDLDNTNLKYKKFHQRSGVYVFVISGELKVQDYILSARDGLGIEGEDELSLISTRNTEVLIMEVPMSLN